MKIAARSMIEGGYQAHGRMWPHSRQIEIDLSKEEYAAVSRDPHIVSVVIPAPVELSPAAEIKAEVAPVHARKGK